MSALIKTETLVSLAIYHVCDTDAAFPLLIVIPTIVLITPSQLLKKILTEMVMMIRNSSLWMPAWADSDGDGFSKF